MSDSIEKSTHFRVIIPSTQESYQRVMNLIEACSSTEITGLSPKQTAALHKTNARKWKVRDELIQEQAEHPNVLLHTKWIKSGRKWVQYLYWKMPKPWRGRAGREANSKKAARRQRRALKLHSVNPYLTQRQIGKRVKLTERRIRDFLKS